MTTLDEALTAVHDGMVVGIGGSPLSRKPLAAVRALADRKPRDLELLTFTGSLDVELLIEAHALRAVRSSHVSLGEAGRAEAFQAAVLAGEVEDLEESEWMLLGRLRAAADGNVQMPWPPDHLADVDVLLARAARHAIVTVERIVPAEEVARTAERTVLFDFEVGAVVEAPRGAWPTASPSDYPANVTEVR